jgi:hypothetical protein
MLIPPVECPEGVLERAGWKDDSMKTRATTYPHALFAFGCALLASWMLFLCGCSREPAAEIRKKLDIVAESDFRAIVTELPKKSLGDSVHFGVMEYREYDKGAYRAKAVVDFYYLRDVHVKRTVKYRYVKSAGKWERFANDYVNY